MVLSGYDTDKFINHTFSLIVYFIYKEWLICSLEKKQPKNTQKATILLQGISKLSIYNI